MCDNFRTEQKLNSKDRRTWRLYRYWPHAIIWSQRHVDLRATHSLRSRFFTGLSSVGFQCVRCLFLLRLVHQWLLQIFVDVVHGISAVCTVETELRFWRLGDSTIEERAQHDEDAADHLVLTWWVLAVVLWTDVRCGRGVKCEWGMCVSSVSGQWVGLSLSLYYPCIPTVQSSCACIPQTYHKYCKHDPRNRREQF